MALAEDFLLPHRMPPGSTKLMPEKGALCRRLDPVEEVPRQDDGGESDNCADYKVKKFNKHLHVCF